MDTSSVSASVSKDGYLTRGSGERNTRCTPFAPSPNLGQTVQHLAAQDLEQSFRPSSLTIGLFRLSLDSPPCHSIPPSILSRLDISLERPPRYAPGLEQLEVTIFRSNSPASSSNQLWPSPHQCCP